MSFTAASLSDLQALLATQYAAQATLPANTDEGSTLGAIFNAVALLAAQQQQNIVYTEGLARLQTSSGADVDTFVAPFGLTRLPAVAATGLVTFSANSPPASPIVVPVGTIVSTANGLQFIVTVDPTQAGWTASSNGYVIPAGTSAKSVAAPVQCLTPGSIGNVQAGTIVSLYGGGTSGIPAGITTVTNSTAFTNGADQENDVQLRARFTAYVSSGPVATANAIAAAVLGVEPGLTYSVGDQKDATGAAAPATATVFVNSLGQSSGPSTVLLNTIQAAVNAVRSAGITVNVVAPTLSNVTPAATLELEPGAVAAAVQTAATTAFNSYVDNIGLDPAGGSTSCGYGRIYALLLGVTGVKNVTGLTLNTGSVDISAGFGTQLVGNATNGSWTTP